MPEVTSHLALRTLTSKGEDKALADYFPPKDFGELLKALLILFPNSHPDTLDKI
ncbi:MAG: hypothetical protein VW729_07340 [Deltaproteobacteria bacterium]